MALNTDAVMKGIHQVRSEMRFYVEKGVPNYSANSAKEAISNLEESIPPFGAKLRSFQTEPLKRLRLLRELTKLHEDLVEYNFQPGSATPTLDIDDDARPVVKPLNQLSQLLKQQQTQRNFPKHDH